ncbi:MAG: DUF2807 domain-containing protein [Bacteroidetes bacterium]|nr:DUF2807 domain-containing protein [Bacteroidota bacterium]
MFITSCHYKSGNINVSNFEKRSVETFTGIDVSNAIEVELTSANEDAVSIGCNKKEVLNKVITEVKDGILKIYIENSFWEIINNDDVRIIAKVSAKNITSLKLSGASSVTTSSTLNNDNLSIEASGASSVKADIKTKVLKINTTGASTVNLSGIADAVDLKASGASTIKNKSLKANVYTVDVSGASNIKLFATQGITGELSGASNLKYSGNPSNVQVNSSGASNVEKD